MGKIHSKYSLHPVGFATDYRTKHIAGRGRLDTIDLIMEDLRDALPCCDIVFEHPDQPQEHIHVEFDPKYDVVFQAAKRVYRETGQWPKE